jgi:2-phospho-L-lactate/phosphoenolpyruvate guanylyltransferase
VLATPGWCVLVPQKSFARAKGRLELDASRRRAVAEALLLDTVAAIHSSPVVHRVVVLWDDEKDAQILPSVERLGCAGRDLNDALAYAAGQIRRDDPDADLAVVPGDLPALTASDLSRCLDIAAGWPRAFLPDLDGVGTTVLTATGGNALAPAYGGCSALAHATSGAHLVDPTGLDSARIDVDDLVSLGRALALGCGHHTRAACAALDRLRGRAALTE